VSLDTRRKGEIEWLDREMMGGRESDMCHAFFISLFSSLFFFTYSFSSSSSHTTKQREAPSTGSAAWKLYRQLSLSFESKGRVSHHSPPFSIIIHHRYQ
jgi:hypothetical protein